MLTYVQASVKLYGSDEQSSRNKTASMETNKKVERGDTMVLIDNFIGIALSRGR